jgi:hypothetical protein
MVGDLGVERRRTLLMPSSAPSTGTSERRVAAGTDRLTARPARRKRLLPRRNWPTMTA